MQAQSARPVKTFTIGFREEAYNEAQHAKVIARHLRTDHTELYVSAQDSLDVIPQLPLLYDEPFADSSQIPTFLVSRLARRHVTVSLSGDGGDELFCGYARYAAAAAIWSKLRWIPAAVRALVGQAIRAVPEAVWTNAFGPGGSNRAERMEARAAILQLPTALAMYRAMVTHWQDPARLVRNSEEPPTVLTDEAALPVFRSFSERMMFLDALTYLPDDILVKVDRASMGVSLEARVPLLDHRVVELAWSLPLRFKQRHGIHKWILRQILNRHVPRALVERPKMGFAVPIDSWLRGPLRPWAMDLLSPARLRREGYLEPGLVHTTLCEHLSGRRNRANLIWNALMFQAWLAAERG
jgi:asparagine synthase (glutamine-hydrolysing)